ncbi:unnamed protein product [Commensalibacter communis]|uniref:AbiTii domain-containing protein n=1 Tax=Commensalibacter communis TaxID=2972786 RepID=UPI0022FF5B33|nr:hypothetical protein [Commensalibacter communis]CAI3943748.1 unnamed protein product [Commensalibacter communis]
MKAIIELQKRAMDSSTDIVELVRYAYAIAQKLDLQDFADWCNAERKGYEYYPNIILPDYRLVHGTIMLSCSDGKRIPMNWTDIQKAEELQQKWIGAVLPSLIGLLHKNDDFISMALSSTLEQYIKNYYDKIFNDWANNVIPYLYAENDFIKYAMIQNKKIEINPYLSVHVSEIVKIVEAVRDKIMDWSLECEGQGILGDEWIFTDKDKQMAQNITYNISSVQNMANQNTDTTINQTAQNMSVTKGDFQSLANFLNDRGISKPNIQELKEIIDIEPNLATEGMENGKLQSWIGKIAIGGSLVAKGVAVETIVEGIKYYLGF